MKAEQQYIDLFTHYEDLICRHAAGLMNLPRVEALADLERLGFPTVKSEDYKYTDVAQAFAPDYGVNINRLDIPVNPYDVFRCDVPNLSTSLYFVVNDTFYDKMLPKAHLPEGVYAGGMRTFMEKYPEVASRYYGKAAPTGKDGCCLEHYAGPGWFCGLCAGRCRSGASDPVGEYLPQRCRHDGEPPYPGDYGASFGSQAVGVRS